MPRALSLALKAFHFPPTSKFLSSKRPLLRAPTAVQLSSGTMGSRQIVVNSEEAALFATLLGAARFGEKEVILRVAGGWVRDKLLGKESDDIDIALDTLLGRQFAEQVNLYLQSKEEAAGKIAVIQANPDQSKHLETARMRIKGTWIDLVNLRSETYSEHSRVPEMEFGTPLQDAMRRDFTINSMFYNINKGVVEDFTEKGLEDLDDKILRTPLPPMDTFLDDPLRVLRAVRFGARFGFRLEDKLQEAASDEKVVVALQQKVSKERVGAELEGMLKCADPVGAIRHLVNLCLFPTVFSLPESIALGPNYGQNCLTVLEAGWKMWSARAPKLELSDEERRLFLLGCLLLPLRNATYLVKKKYIPASFFIVREHLKLKTKDAENIESIHRSFPRVLKAMTLLREKGSIPTGEALSLDPEVNARVALGVWVRELKELWTLGALLLPLLSLPEAKPMGVDDPGPDAMELMSSNSGSEDLWSNQLSIFDELHAAICGFELSEAWKTKPLLDGKSMMEALGMERGGPMLGEAMQKAVLWQLANPTGSKGELETYIRGEMAQRV